MCPAIIMILFLPCVWGAGEISKQKCEQYSKAVNIQQESPLLLPGAGKQSVSGCGIVEVPLIVGGSKASGKEFPHMCVIGFGASSTSEMDWQCGGALISERAVLTAAHCLNSRDSGPAQKLKLGTINLKSNEGTVYDVSERIPHPQYKPPLKYNDIGILKLRNNVQFTAYVRPACLNTNLNLQASKAIASGFGKLTYDSATGSDILMKVQLDIISNSECENMFTTARDKMVVPQGVNDLMICAGVLAGGKDTCQGDSGGPLQIVLSRPYCMYSIIGITSFGKFCGFPNSPAIYVRVSSYLSWIEDVTWK